MNSILDQLDEAEKAATPGDWKPQKGATMDYGYCDFRYATGPHLNYMTKTCGTAEYSKDVDKLNAQLQADANLIALSRNNIRALIDCARTLKKFKVAYHTKGENFPWVSVDIEIEVDEALAKLGEG